MDFLSYLNNWMQLLSKLFLTKLIRIHIWININFIENCHRMTCKTNFKKISD